VIPLFAEFEALGAAIGACAFFGFMTAVCVVASRQERRKMDLAYAERMKRVELGVPEPPSDRSWPRAFVCMTVGAGVPVVAFGSALIAYVSRPSTPDEIWIAPAIVAVVSVVTGGILAANLLGPGQSIDPAPTDAGVARVAADAKLNGDPDTFDVVARRG
jgi:hypothetical protein